MNRTSWILAGAIAAGLLGGCARDKKPEETSSKYKVLSGSTRNVAAAEKGESESTAEPALNADTRFAAGQLAESRGQLDCAVVQYDQALRLNANHVASLYRLGIVYIKTREYPKAIESWQRYVKATNELPSAYSNLGYAYEMAGDPEKAELSYKKGLSLDPINVPCRVNYGLMLARQNRTDEASGQLATVLTPAEVSYNLAAVYEQQGALARAKDSYKKALEQNPNLTAAQTKLAALPQD